MTTSEQTLKSVLANQFTWRVENTVAHLRDLANEIERIGHGIHKVPNGPVPGVGTSSAAGVAQEIVHSVMWGLANANVDGIVSAAAEYDQLMAAELRGEGKDGGTDGG